MNKNVFKKEICSYCENKCSRKLLENNVEYSRERTRGEKKIQVLRCKFYIRKK